MYMYNSAFLWCGIRLIIVINLQVHFFTFYNDLEVMSDVFFSPWQVVGLNFSSATTPELLLKTFDQYCEYKRTPNGVVLSPIQMNKWLVLFCDEINLPNMDKYSK